METGWNNKDDGNVTERVTRIIPDETPSSSMQVPKSEVNRNESAANKFPFKELEIVITVAKLRNNDSLSQGTMGSSINSSEDCVSDKCLENSPAGDPNKDGFINKNDLSAIIIRRSETGDDIAEGCQEEPVCRICHLSSEQSPDADMKENGGNATASKLIQLGCGCKDELGIAHSLCAEAWFKIKGNRRCEICSEIARNISGVCDDSKWSDRLSVSRNINGRSEQGSCWRGQSFCNFLMACLVIAFVLPWFFRVKMF